jgi:hypothetical protein
MHSQDNREGDSREGDTQDSRPADNRSAHNIPDMDNQRMAVVAVEHIHLLVAGRLADRYTVVAVGHIHLLVAGRLADRYMAWERHDIADHMPHTVDLEHKTQDVDLSHTVPIPVAA